MGKTFALIMFLSSPTGSDAYKLDHGLTLDDCRAELSYLQAAFKLSGQCEAEYHS